MSNTFDKDKVVESLRAQAIAVYEKSESEGDMTFASELIDEVANYLSFTADGYSRETYAEIAFAFIAGGSDSTGAPWQRGDTRTTERAIRAAGLGI